MQVEFKDSNTYTSYRVFHAGNRSLWGTLSLVRRADNDDDPAAADKSHVSEWINEGGNVRKHFGLRPTALSIAALCRF